jgi:endonuclease YncB( thermonuclease family)
MPKGLLTVVGSLDVSQFWPASKGTASSDGDTVHLKVDPNNSFLYAGAPGTSPKVTKAYVGAYALDQGKKKNVITSKSEIKIRLQGIDAPELHYPVIGTRDPSKKGKGDEFRQAYGASAAKALHDYLQGKITGSGTVIHANFVTQIDHPADAIDSHGRFVGDVVVGTAGSESINTWMVKSGWAYPLFYDSMTAGEINTLLAAWKLGKGITGRAGKNFQRPLLPFDPSVTVNNAKVPDPGKVNFPKLFRRQATFWASIPGPLSATQFAAMLAKGAKGKSDRAYPLAYFLANITKLDPKKRVTLSSQIGAQGQAKFDPPDLVYKEDPSSLYSASGKKVTSW